jgi:hypothetical protein
VLTAVALAACAAPVPVPPLPTEPVFAGPPPPERLVRFETVAIAEGRLVTLEFIGGKPFMLGDPCSHDYFGWAQRAGDELQAAVVDVTPRIPAPEGDVILCTLGGYPRAVTVELEEPFSGTTVRDLAGYVHFVGRPGGAVELRGLPRGWRLASEGEVPDSPTGRWRQTFADAKPGSHDVELYQAFGGPASVSGGAEPRSVKVGGKPAQLDRQASNGELVLVWQLGSDGLALVAYEQDFSVDELIALAESAVIPED